MQFLKSSSSTKKLRKKLEFVKSESIENVEVFFFWSSLQAPCWMSNRIASCLLNRNVCADQLVLYLLCLKENEDVWMPRICKFKRSLLYQLLFICVYLIETTSYFPDFKITLQIQEHIVERTMMLLSLSSAKF